MSLNETASGERIHIGFFGMRNAGKSSLVNAVTAQKLSVVSSVKGTTTDPVKKAMELLPLGPVVIIDTPGFDDEGTLGALRVEKTRETLAKTDIAVLVVDAVLGLQAPDRELISLFDERKKPYIIAYNKSELLSRTLPLDSNSIYVSAETKQGVEELKKKIAAFAKKDSEKKPVSDLLKKGDTVILVTPIDEAAPKGRIILPQQLVLRDILDAHCTAIVCQPNELTGILSLLKAPPRLVITDSQVFGPVSKLLPNDIELTSFSIIMARYKGNLTTLVKGAAELSRLNDGDKVLICEGCTHHRQCNDIGTVKIPSWIEDFSGAKPDFSFTSGGTFPSEEELKQYRLIVHCGGCMLGEAEMLHRINTAEKVGVPIVNYGVAIANIHGILKRSLAPFEDVSEILQ